MTMRGKGYTEIELKRIISARSEDIRCAKMQIAEAVENKQKGIQKYPADNQSIILSSYEYCFKSGLALIDAMYSLGQSVESLIRHFNRAVDDLDKSYLRDDYNPKNGMWGNYEALLEILSWGILLETDDDTMRKIAAAILYHNAAAILYHNTDDALIDFLLLACNIGWQHHTTKYYVPNPYKFLQDIILAAQCDKVEASRLLETYIKKKWRSDDGWSYESAAVAKILGLDDSRLKANSRYPYELSHSLSKREFSSVCYPAWLEIICKKQDGAQQLVKEKEFIRVIESDYNDLSEQAFYEKYRERFLKDLFPDVQSYNLYRKMHHGTILGFLLVNALVIDVYVLQMDWKDYPEECLPDFINERLETDYGIEAIDLGNAVPEFEDVEMYDTKYVKSLQKMLKRIGFRLVWFMLGNDQYYTAVVPKTLRLGNVWKGIELHYS